jgi:hypothetical protein
MIGSSQDLNMNRWWRWEPSSYCYGPIVQGRLLTHHFGGDHGDEEGLRWWFPSPAGCREELLDPPDLTSTTVAACSRFHGKLIGPLRFSRWGDYIGGRAMSGGGPGAHTWSWCSQGVACAMPWCGRPLVPLRLIFRLRLVSGKIGILAFVSSNSENIFCVDFLKHKNCKNRELALWHLVNRLVL